MVGSRCPYLYLYLRSSRGYIIQFVVVPSTSQQRSYASAASSPGQLAPTIAVTPPDSLPNVRSLSELSATRSAARTRHQPPCVELNLQDTQCDIGDSPKLHELMNRALQSTPELQETKCQGVSARRMGKVVFVFESELQVQAVKKKEPWKNVIEADFAQARLIAQERFKVKLSGVDKSKIGNPNRGEPIADEVINAINAENKLSIQAARLLSPPSERRTAQLVLVCANQDEKESLLNKGFISVQSEIAYISEFFESQVLQCRKCGEFNHMARNCKNQEKCLKCSEQGHSAAQCSNNPRCCNCFQDHHSQSTACPMRQRQTHFRRANEW